jgi:hypothetical protein
MHARQLFVGCLALVLLARAVHCLYVDVALCAYASTLATDSRPLSDPTETDPNESGCLCKGALVETPCPLADLQNSLTAPAQVTLAPVVGLAPSTSGPTPQELLWRPPRSGRMVRALFVSWQI